MRIRVLVADDSAVSRRAIVGLLKEDSDIEVVGVAQTLAETLELAVQVKPRILVLDVFMPDESGFAPAYLHLELLKFELLKHVQCILAVTDYVDAEAKARALLLGAKILLDKLNLYSQLIPTIKRYCVPRLRHRTMP
jgi:DNA-binding NarL/FixJ family response regulator